MPRRDHQVHPQQALILPLMKYPLFLRLALFTASMLLCGGLFRHFIPLWETQRFLVEELGDFVDGQPRQELPNSAPTFEHGIRLSISLFEFHERYPDGCSDVLSAPVYDPDAPEKEPTQSRLSFGLPEALPDLYRIWDAPLKARVTALLYGTNPISRIPGRLWSGAGENPMLRMWDTMRVPRPDGGYVLCMQDGTLIKEGSYFLRDALFYWLELRKNGLVIIPPTSCIYRLREGRHYQANTFPQTEDWEFVGDYSVLPDEVPSVLPFGTYMFTSSEREEQQYWPDRVRDKNTPPVFIRIISFKPAPQGGNIVITPPQTLR